MAKIIKQFGFNDKREQYNLLNSPAGKMRDHVGERLQVAAWAFIERENRETGEVTTVFMVKTIDGEMLGTSSRSFCEGVETFLACFDEEELTEFEIGKAISRGGREYLVFKA